MVLLVTGGTSVLCLDDGLDQPWGSFARDFSEKHIHSIF